MHTGNLCDRGYAQQGLRMGRVLFSLGHVCPGFRRTITGLAPAARGAPDPSAEGGISARAPLPPS